MFLHYSSSWQTSARFIARLGSTLEQNAYLLCVIRCTAPARSAARPDYTARPDCLAPTPTLRPALRASQPAMPLRPDAGSNDVPSQALISGCSPCSSSAITAGVQRTLSARSNHPVPHSAQRRRTTHWAPCGTVSAFGSPNTHGSPWQAEVYSRAPALLHICASVC